MNVGFAPRVRKTVHTCHMTRVELARVVAHHFGWTARSGGWIYDDLGRPRIQGWEAFADRLERRGLIVVGKGVCWREIGSTLKLPY